MIGLWGCFDCDTLGDLLTARVARAELRRRLPHAELRLFAPVGSTRATVLAAAEPVEPLLPADEVVARALAATLSLVVRCGDEERWHPDALVGEYGIAAPVAQRLSALALGADANGPPPVPHPDVPAAVLAATVLGADLLDRRAAFARAVGWAPAAGPFVAVQTTATDRIPEIADAVRGDEVTVVVPAGGDDVACAALATTLGTPFVLPPIASVEDRVAVVRDAVRVVATDPAVRAVAGSDPHRVAALHAGYDEIAARLGADASAPLVLPEIAAMRAALDARGRRLAAERLAFADALRAAHADRDHARAELAALAAAHDRRSWRALLRRVLGRS